MEIKIAVIEDSDDAFLTVKDYLTEYSQKTSYGFNIMRFEYSENFLENYKPVYDIVVMDIMLPGMNGMDAAIKLRTLDPKVVLIFVTNMSQYALKGYEVDALDYVLKPINYYSFIMRIEKALRRIGESCNDKMLRLRTENGVRLVAVSDIYLVDILRHYVTVHTNNGEIRSYGVLGDVEKQLPNTFVRCSACAIVNLKCVKGIYGDEIELKNGVTVHIGRTKKKNFMLAFSNYVVGGGGNVMKWHSVFLNSVYGTEVFLAALIFLSAYKRKKNFWAWMPISLAFLLAGIFVTSFFPFTKLFRFLQLLSLNIFIFVGFNFCYKTAVSNVLFSCTAAMAVQQICAGLLYLLKIVFSFGSVMPDYYIATILNELIVYAPMYTLFGLYFNFSIKNKLDRGVGSMKMKIMSAVIVLICTGVYRFADASTTDGVIARSLYSIICNAFALILQFAFYEQMVLRRDISMEKELRRQEIKHYEKWRDSVEIINLKYHDLKHQISSLQKNNDDENWREIKNALNTYDNMLKTGNEALDIILSEKRMLSDKFNITLTCMADGAALERMHESDIYSLFGNALDNAVNAVKELEEVDKRNISLIVRRAGDAVMIHVENFYEGKIAFSDGLPQTDKDKNFHGYGARSMRMIAEKYNGLMNYSVTENVFGLDIVMQP